MINLSTARALDAHNCRKSSQSAHQADGLSPLITVVGESCISMTCKQKVFTFGGLVVENLDVDILAGTPFKYLAISTKLNIYL